MDADVSDAAVVLPRRARGRGLVWTVRLDVTVAVSVDVEALLEAAGPRVGAAGREHVAQGRVSGLTPVDGGVRATVAGREGGRTQVSVTVAGRALVVDCDRDSELAGDLCEHAVAVVLAARDTGMTWTSMALLRGAEPAGQERGRLVAEAAASLTRAELARLVVAQAAEDRLFAAKVLRRAGKLEPPSPTELMRIRGLVRDVGRIPVDGDRWELHDLVEAGREMLADLEILAVGPVTVEFVDVVEDAIGVWDGLAGYLGGAWEVLDTEGGEIGESFAALHLRLCDELQPDPAELGRRLAELVEAAHSDSCLDAPDGYADLLGDEGLDAYESALHH